MHMTNKLYIMHCLSTGKNHAQQALRNTLPLNWKKYLPNFSTSWKKLLPWPNLYQTPHPSCAPPPPPPSASQKSNGRPEGDYILDGVVFNMHLGSRTSPTDTNVSHVNWEQLTQQQAPQCDQLWNTTRWFKMWGLFINSQQVMSLGSMLS